MDDQEYTLFGEPIERLKKPFCEKCSDLWKDEQYPLSYNCEMDTLYFGIVRAPGIYKPKERGENHLSEYIRKFKYDDSLSDSEREEIAEEFANLIHKYISDENEIIDGVDYLVPVPMTEKKEKEKRFNHTRIITEKFSEKVEIRAEYGNLVKIRETESQTNLNREERRENVRDAFCVKYPSRFRGRKVLLIDDVATTCSTIDECAKMLRNAGAREVNALILARDTKPRGVSDG